MSSKLRLRLETAKRLQKLNENRKNARQKKKEAKLNLKELDPEKHVSITRVPRVKKNTLAKAPQATSKFKRRQINKTWLPTHIWHTKRAHLTPPTLPLWRMAVPLRPSEKSYRATHRAVGARGCVAWDASYMSTVGCQGTDTTLVLLLKALNFHGEGWTGAKFRRWTAGIRHAEGWISERDDQKRLIAPVSVFWRPSDKPGLSSDQRTKLGRRLFIRIHPSAFHQFWLELLKVAKMQKPQVLVEDLRFEIGSISICGPGSSEAIAGVLKLDEQSSQLQDLWSVLPMLSSPSALPQGAMLAFDTLDPRYNHPPRQVTVRRTDEDVQKLNELLVNWVVDKHSPTSRLFDHRERYKVSKSLPSQKAINRRKSSSLPGQGMQTNDKDPKIPVVLLAHRSLEPSAEGLGSWTVLVPWSCVDVVWRSLMYYPLSTGSTPRFGGLEQTQQVAFEQAVPWFPGDFPATEAGKAWERTKAEERFDTWLRRPTSKRFSWESLDLGSGRKGELGRGWTCDWEYLFEDTSPKIASPVDVEATDQPQKLLLTQKQRKAALAEAERRTEEQARRRNTSSPESDAEPEPSWKTETYAQLSPTKAASLLSKYSSTKLTAMPTLAAVSITYLTKGTPKAPARIYRLPSILDSTIDDHANPEANPKPKSKSKTSTSLRQRWLSLDANPSTINPSSSTSLAVPIPKERRNHHDDLVRRTAYNAKYTKDVSHIRVFPPHETNPKVLDMFGPKPPPRTTEETMKILQPQDIPKMTVDSEGTLVKEEIWDRHVPCPGEKDLIGFVTSGGYSLARGRGTAVGSIWVQRIVEGWKTEDGENGLNQGGEGRKTSDVKAKTEKARLRQVERERHLCIVRNAGESVGRLAIWELC